MPVPAAVVIFTNCLNTGKLVVILSETSKYQTMKTILIFILISISILTISFRNETKYDYEIIGSVIGFTDSTLLYLDDVTDGSFKHIDSAFIIGGKFIFKGSLENKTTKAYIRTKDFRDRFLIWLENATIYVSAEKGKFRDANIKGSKTQDEQSKLNHILDSSKNKNDKELQFVQDNPNSIISASILSTYSSIWGKDTTSLLYKKFSKEIKSTYYGKKIFEFITLNKNIKIGEKYVNISQPDKYGKNINLSDFHGKIVLLEFWGSWCGPCREGNPELFKIYNDFNMKGFEIFGVAAESNKEQWLKAIETDKLSWTNVTDFNGDKNKAALIYGVSKYPTNYLIDKTGTVIAKDISGEKLREQLLKIL